MFAKKKNCSSLQIWTRPCQQNLNVLWFLPTTRRWHFHSLAADASKWGIVSRHGGSGSNGEGRGSILVFTYDRCLRQTHGLFTLWQIGELYPALWEREITWFELLAYWQLCELIHVFWSFCPGDLAGLTRSSLTLWNNADRQNYSNFCTVRRMPCEILFSLR
jgi:hypothetical protein